MYMLNPIRLLLFSVAVAMSATASSQVVLVEKGKPKARITLAAETDVNRKAANILQRFIREN